MRTEEQQQHEEAFVSAFVLPQRRERWVTLLGNPRRRAAVTRTLDHQHDLDDRTCVPVVPSNLSDEEIAAALRARGAPARCWVISASPRLDGRYLELVEALNEISGSGRGAALSCVPGRLGYFEGEHGTCERYFLIKPPKALP